MHQMSEKQRKMIAKRLRAAREQAGLSQGQVAIEFGLQRPTVSEIEAGRRKVSGEELQNFAKLYKVSISWLANEKPEVENPAVELAARELAKLKSDDFDNIMNLLKTLRKKGQNDDAE